KGAAMLATVLVIVTLCHTDAPHVSFSATADAGECATKSETVTGMLAGAGYQIAAARCIETDLRFAPYDHAATEMDAAYLITLPAEPASGGTIDSLRGLSD